MLASDKNMRMGEGLMTTGVTRGSGLGAEQSI